METTKTVNFEKKEYPFVKEEGQWQVELKKSEVGVDNEKELVLLTLHNDLLLPVTIDWQEDYIRFNYAVQREYMSFAELKRLPREEKIRGAFNSAQVKDLCQLPLTFFLDPENIVFDRNLLPKIVHRGLKEKMAPENFSEETLLRQYKAFVITLFEDNVSFTELYDGHLELQFKSAFVKKIQESETFEDIEEYLDKLYQSAKEHNAQNTKRVTKRQFLIFQQLAIWMSVVTVLLLIPLGYFFFSRIPFQEKMLAADAAFLSNDYHGVIETLDDIKVERIPMAQKYIGAYSVVESASLSEEQKNAVLNNLSLRSSENYLSYWMLIGRGEFEEALDVGKGMEDVDLILYALAGRIEQVRNDTKLSGSEKEEEISSLQDEYNRYDKERSEAIGEDGEEEDLDLEEDLEEEPEPEESAEDEDSEKEQEGDE